MYDEIVRENKTKYSLNKQGDIYITNEEIEILKSFGFNYKEYSSVSTLVFDVQEYLNSNYEELLDYAITNIAERKYYSGK